MSAKQRAKPQIMKSPAIRLSLLLCSAIAAFATAVHASPRLMQGPMMGNIEPTSATIWARVAGEADFSVRYSANSDFSDAKVTPAVHASAENDYCVEVTIEGLKSGSFYHYQALVDGQPLDATRERDGYPFLTAPSDDLKARFSIAFGAGAKTEMDGLQAIWLQVQNARPHAFFWLGDNESAENLAPAFQAEEYRKQRSVPFLQPLLRSIPQLATWDGAKAGADGKSLDVFRRYWANPAYGTEDNPGSYFKFSYGKVDFFFLDTYSYRQPGAHMLGDEQLAWLKSELAASKTAFKVLLSSSSWTDIKDNSASTWTAFPQERANLFGFIKNSDIQGVVLVSGDNDQAEIKAIPMSDVGGYDLYELVSSPLARDPEQSSDEQDPSIIPLHEPYSACMNFGMLTFDMTEADPSFSFEIINVFGESIFPPLVVRASELTNGTASWQTKVDDPEAYAFTPDEAAQSATAN